MMILFIKKNIKKTKINKNLDYFFIEFFIYYWNALRNDNERYKIHVDQNKK